MSQRLKQRQYIATRKKRLFSDSRYTLIPIPRLTLSRKNKKNYIDYIFIYILKKLKELTKKFNASSHDCRKDNSFDFLKCRFTQFSYKWQYLLTLSQTCHDNLSNVCSILHAIMNLQKLIS